MSIWIEGPPATLDELFSMDMVLEGTPVLFGGYVLMIRSDEEDQ